jgi:hypothetical protein
VKIFFWGAFSRRRLQEEDEEMGEAEAQFPQGGGEVCFDGLFRDAQFGRYLFMSIAFIAAELEYDPAFFRQGFYEGQEFGLQFVGLQVLEGVVVGFLPVIQGLLPETPVAAFYGEAFEDLVFYGCGEIGIEGVVDLELFPASPQVAKHFLYDFPGFFQIAQAVHGYDGQFIPITEVDGGEGFIVVLF